MKGTLEELVRVSWLRILPPDAQCIAGYGYAPSVTGALSPEPGTWWELKSMFVDSTHLKESFTVRKQCP